MVRIVSTVGQKLTQRIRRIIRDEFKELYKFWKEQGLYNLKGKYTIYVLKDVECVFLADSFIEVLVEKDDCEVGYLHVYGLSEVEN